VWTEGTVTGEVAWVPDAPGADVLLVVCSGGEAVVVEAGDADVEPVAGYDATRALGHVRLRDAPCSKLDLRDGTPARAWYVAQGLLGAEAVGAIDLALQSGVQYAKERFTFGRPIGSYQAIKHELVEILRRLENARSLMYYAGWAAADKPDELPVAASAFRLVASEALDHAARTLISVHGGIGATWEHDAPLYFRRAQLDKRLLGGTTEAADRVSDELFAQARAG
jgi:alkylation response protein AidB-like acyl-CoA dehydrogenase